LEELIVVVDADEGRCEALRTLLERNSYTSIGLRSLMNLEKTVRQPACRAVILDLDSLPISNRDIRDLTKQNPGLIILVLSERTFHPELKEAMSHYIHACLTKPVDPEELFYWLKAGGPQA
jgi:DNA-binding NtrC family response regulator